MEFFLQLGFLFSTNHPITIRVFLVLVNASYMYYYTKMPVHMMPCQVLVLVRGVTLAFKVTTNCHYKILEAI
jgi:hypothetical protein